MCRACHLTHYTHPHVTHVARLKHALPAQILDADELAMALGECNLEPPKLRIAVGFDCSATNRRAGKSVFSGKPLHASTPEGMLGPDPNPYQLALFMLGKALEAVGVGSETAVRCFCFNTTSYAPQAQEASPRSATASHASSPAALADVLDATDAAPASGGVVVGSRGERWAAPVACEGMEGALAYYNALPPYIFRGARGAGAAGGLAQAVQYGGALAQQDAADGSTCTLLLLLTPGQGIDAGAARSALQEMRYTSLSVVALGVGDGPFFELGRLATACPLNFNAVDFHTTTATKFPDRALALEALRTLPEQVTMRATTGTY